MSADPRLAYEVEEPVWSVRTGPCPGSQLRDRFHSAHDLALEAVSSGASRPSWVSVARGRRLVWTGALVALVVIAGIEDPEPDIVLVEGFR